MEHIDTTQKTVSSEISTSSTKGSDDKKPLELSKRKKRGSGTRSLNRRLLAGPEGSVELVLCVPQEVKEMLEAKLRGLSGTDGKNVSMYTLLQYLVTEENLANAEISIKKKLSEYEELKRRQNELGIHLV